MTLPESSLYGPVEEISKAADRAAVLTQQLLAFSRHQVIQPRRFDVNHRVIETHRILKRLIGEDIQLGISSGRKHRPDHGRPRAGRSSDYQPGGERPGCHANGGRLLIETAALDVAEAYAASHFGVQPGPHVMLAITDSGTGMTPECRVIFSSRFSLPSRQEGHRPGPRNRVRHREAGERRHFRLQRAGSAGPRSRLSSRLPLTHQLKKSAPMPAHRETW